MNRAPNSILLLLLMPIGDTLFATPTIRALRLSYAGARIVALAYPTNAGVLEANPDIDRLMLHPTAASWTGWTQYLGLIWRLRSTQFDLIVSFGPAQWWLSRLIGARTVRRLVFPVWKWFLPGGSRPWRERHAVTNYSTLLHKSERAFMPSGPILTSSTQDKTAIMSRIGPEDSVLVALHPGGEGFRGMKRWPIERFATLACELSAIAGVKLVVIGGAEEVALAKRVTEQAVGARSFAGCLNLGETVALLQRCALFIGNDSAPLHMAAALGIPTIGLYGPTSRVNFRPRGARTIVIDAGLACSPCFHFVGSAPLWAASRCRVPSCMQAIARQSVVAQALDLLRGQMRGPSA